MAVNESESLKSNGTFLGRRIARVDGVAKVTGQATTLSNTIWQALSML